MNIQTVTQAQTDNVIPYLKHEGCLPEADRRTNQLSRAIIRAYLSNGSAWVGNINRYSDMKNDPYLAEYKSGMVYNFQYSFVAPEYDQTLVDMIYNREHSEYTGTRNDYKLVEAIMARIDQLGGQHLFWT